MESVAGLSTATGGDDFSASAPENGGPGGHKNLGGIPKLKGDNDFLRATNFFF